jgi:hypothetical protein
MNFIRKNIISLVIVIATLLMAGVAVFTAWRLYRARTTAPQKSGAALTTAHCDLLSFTISEEELACNSACTADAQCSVISDTDSYICDTTTDTCRLESNPTSETCAQLQETASPSPTATATATPSPTPTGTGTPRPTSTPTATHTPTPTPEPSLPTAGLGLPTTIGVVTGVILMIGALILAI